MEKYIGRRPPQEERDFMGIKEYRWEIGNPQLVIVEKITNFSDLPVSRESRESIDEFLGNLKENYQKEGVAYEKTSNLQNPGMFILNPVYLGELPDQVIGYLKGSGKLETLRNSLPESYPLAVQIGRKLKINPTPHPNFCNVIFFEDAQNVFDAEINSSRLINFIRALMAKLGSFKIILIPLSNPDLPILGTLEGGHPRLDLKTLTHRIRILGSVKPVGGIEPLNNLSCISKEVWEGSNIVRQMQDLGKFLQEKGLLNPPIKIEDFIKDQKLARLIGKFAGFMRQQEGAFAAFTPEFSNYPSPWDGIYAVSRSGSDQGIVIKSELRPEDIIPLIPLKNKKVGQILIKDLPSRKPSVEAEEFILPLSGVEPEEVSDEAQEIKAPPIIGIIHIHGSLNNLPGELGEKVILLEPDIERYPPVGCGVDAMQAMSAYFMNQAIDQWGKWPKQNSKLEIAIAPVPNHGTNIFCFLKLKEDGTLYLPEDPFSSFKQLVDHGLSFTLDVPQV